MRYIFAVLLSVMTALPATACTVPPGAAAAVEEVLKRTNTFRVTRTRKRVSLNPALMDAAQAHACYMAQSGNFDHTGAGGSSVGDRALSAGYRWSFVSENIAMGHRSGDEVFEGWKGSPGHRDNMLDRDAREIGIAVAASGGTLYWAMVLARPM